MIILFGTHKYWSEHPIRGGAAATTALLALALLLPAGLARAGEPTIEELLNGTDDMYRGESSEGTITMNVKTARWERSMSMKMWTKGTEKSLIIIESPPKEAGMATLKVEDNIWNCLPKVDRTMKIPASMMSGSWMGSHFTNDDLVKESRMVNDYTFVMASKPADNEAAEYVIECTPKPDAPVVWGKVIVKITGESELASEITYWDEKGNLKRTMTFSDQADVGGRQAMTRMKMIPADKPEEFTEVIYSDIRYDVDVPDETFTLQALK